MNPFWRGRSGTWTKFGSGKPKARGFSTPDANNCSKAEGQWKATVALHYLTVLHPAHTSADTTVPSLLPVFNSSDPRKGKPCRSSTGEMARLVAPTRLEHLYLPYCNTTIWITVLLDRNSTTDWALRKKRKKIGEQEIDFHKAREVAATDWV